MSGLIGGAGSKSGVIGETEIDYEEGTWTPTMTNAHSNTTGRYIKIGKMVHCIVYVQMNSAANSSGNFGALPFAAGMQGQAHPGGGTQTYSNDTNNPRALQILVNADSTFTLMDGYLTVILRLNKNFQASFTYRTTN